jgi:uncharacterized protein
MPTRAARKPGFGAPIPAPGKCPLPNIKVRDHYQPFPRIAVLDTQAVLDWLYFQDPACARWTAWHEHGLWRWEATPPMREELTHVLARGLPGGGHRPRPQDVLAGFDAYAVMRSAPQLGLGAGLRCTDPDDQKFIDLAVSLRANWLVSRDRAVLRLRKRLASRGVQTVRPAEWRPDAPVPHAQ